MRTFEQPEKFKSFDYSAKGEDEIMLLLADMKDALGNMAVPNPETNEKIPAIEFVEKEVEKLMAQGKNHLRISCDGFKVAVEDIKDER